MTRYFLIGLAVTGLLASVQTYRLDRVKRENALIERELEIVKAELEAYDQIARTDMETVLSECEVRVAEARRSARRIETIIERPYAVDPSGCPVRDLLSSNELSDALQPQTPSP